MSYFYAQLDASGMCYAVTQTHAPVDAPSMVSLASYSTSVLNKRWTGTHWEEAHQPEAPLDRHITKRAFRARFTKAERVAIEWASVDRSDASLQERQLAAALRADLKDQEQASYIDLDATDVMEGLQQLAAFGLIEPHRPAEILTATVQDAERLTT